MNENTKLEAKFHGEFKVAPRDPKTGLVDEKAPKVMRYRYEIVTKGSAREQYVSDMEELTQDGTCPMIMDSDTPAYFATVKRSRLIIERSVNRDGDLRGYFPIKDEIDEITQVLNDDSVSEYEKAELGSLNAKNRLAEIRKLVAQRSRIVTKTVVADDTDTDNTEKAPASEDLDGLIG